ncbi:MAG: hypothetical protein LBG87_09935 [Spirochaetaceae bacterium]|jgi:hypothetical protein|nr:hypothetical protein [Spirochaetaceae bacterium]
MAKTLEGDRLQYEEKTQTYRTEIAGISKWEAQMLEELEQRDSASKRFALAEGMFNLTSYHILLNSISQAVLRINNEEALGEARKSISRGFGYLEDLVTGYVDAPFSDYAEKVAALEGVDGNRRYNLVRKIGLAIQLFQNSYRDNSKWRWTFVETEGRFAAIAKNLIDMANINANLDPRSSVYESTAYHLRLIKRLLNEASDRYRERYEQATNHINDFQASLNFMNALRRLHIILGESGEAETIKKKVDVWEAKMQGDLNKKQEDKIAEATS